MVRAVIVTLSVERFASLKGRDRGRNWGELPVERKYDPQLSSLHKTLKHPDELHEISAIFERLCDNLNCDIDDRSSLELREATCTFRCSDSSKEAITKVATEGFDAKVQSELANKKTRCSVNVPSAARESDAFSSSEVEFNKSMRPVFVAARITSVRDVVYNPCILSGAETTSLESRCFSEDTDDRLSFHLQMVLPPSSASENSAEVSITAYVAYSSSKLSVTAGHENDVEGPSVCDTTEWRLEVSTRWIPSACTETVTSPSLLLLDT